MTRIKKLKVRNFKKFADRTFEFNEVINILDNECGKSSILEAIELVLNLCHRGKPLSPEVMAEPVKDHYPEVSTGPKIG
jgi:putative ATP-dependent endonuclease of OLD family